MNSKLGLACMLHPGVGPMLNVSTEGWKACLFRYVFACDEQRVFSTPQENIFSKIPTYEFISRDLFNLAPVPFVIFGHNEAI